MAFNAILTFFFFFGWEILIMTIALNFKSVVSISEKCFNQETSWEACIEWHFVLFWLLWEVPANQSSLRDAGDQYLMALFFGKAWQWGNWW